MDEVHPIITPSTIIAVGMIFIHSGSLHLADILGISQIIADPDATDKIDIITIGLITALDSTDDE